jgi:hypothetical protein
MKTMNRRALAALVFGFLMVTSSTAFAQGGEKGHGCCKAESLACSSCCTAEKRSAGAYNETAERFRAKYGREYPGKRSTARQNNASAKCCTHCC